VDFRPVPSTDRAMFSVNALRAAFEAQYAGSYGPGARAESDETFLLLIGVTHIAAGAGPPLRATSSANLRPSPEDATVTTQIAPSASDPCAAGSGREKRAGRPGPVRRVRPGRLPGRLYPARRRCIP
jgi:hypothetical protein